MHKNKETVFFERGDTKDRNNGFNVLLAASVVVFSGCFLKTYCLTAIEYLSKHPKTLKNIN